MYEVSARSRSEDVDELEDGEGRDGEHPEAEEGEEAPDGELAHVEALLDPREHRRQDAVRPAEDERIPHARTHHTGC